MNEREIQNAARWLHDAHRRGDRYEPLEVAAAKPPLEDAYRVQQALRALRIADGAGPVVGYKIALTSRAMQEMCGVDHPLAGAILADVVHPSPARRSLADYGRVGVEFEVAVRLGRDLPAAGAAHSRESVAGAVDACMPAYELVDDRNADYSRIEAFTAIADNCWNAGVVLGSPVAGWQTLDLVGGVTRLEVNGAPEGEGRIGDALGHPLEAVAWLANLLATTGERLEAGMIVMTGSSITTRFPSAGDRYRFEIEGLGGVELDWEE